MDASGHSGIIGVFNVIADRLMTPEHPEYEYKSPEHLIPRIT